MGFTERALTPSVHCKLYEYNSELLEMARKYKYCPGPKFLNVKLHHFSDYVDRCKINIHNISTEDQPADYVTKPLYQKTMISTGRLFKYCSIRTPH